MAPESSSVPAHSPTPSVRPATPTEELAYTSYLRIAAMIGVVLIHSMSAIVGNREIQGSTTWWTATALDTGASWAVPAFIMVSGALLLGTGRGESAGAFYRRRLQRIAIPLVVAHVGYFAVRALIGEHLTVAVIVRDLLRAGVYTHLYFFWIILGLYLVTPLVRSALAGHEPRTLAVIGLAGMAWMWAVHASATLLAAVGAPTTVWQPAALVLWLPYVGYFILGYALRDVILDRRWLAVAIGIFLAASAVAIARSAGLLPGVSAAVLFAGGYQGLPVATATVCLYLVARTLLRPGVWLTRGTPAAVARHLGALSLGVFIIHFAVLRLGWLHTPLTFGLVKRSLPADLLLFGLVTVSSFAVCALIARIPILRRAIGM